MSTALLHTAPNDIDYSIIVGLLRGLRPDPILLVPQWSDGYRVLPPTSAEPGPFRNSRTPYLIEIGNKLSSTDKAQRIIFKKSSQVGATELGNNWCGYTIDVSPCGLLYIMPTDHMMKTTSKTRIQPMIDASPSLQKKISPARSREGGNTMMTKEFRGGFLHMIGANSPVGLSSIAVRRVYCDETDRYPINVGEEGDVISLAETRTISFGDSKKIFLTSTPTIKGASIIDNEFQKTGQRYYHLPCPHCATLIILKFDQLKYELGKYSDVYYECQDCGGHIFERHKTKMLLNGQWIALYPEREDGKTFGYHINALYSPVGWYSWAQMAEEFEKSKENIPKKITFVNTKLGEVYEAEGDSPAWEAVYNKRENFKTNKPNKNVVFVTAGVDIQKDRIELEIVGWGKGKESWSIDFRVLEGATDTFESPVWDKLSSVLDETFIREDNAGLQIKLMAVDSGYNTSVVYEFARKHFGKVIATKGQAEQILMVSPPRSVETSRSGKKIGVKVWNVGVSMIKTELYGYLNLQKHENEDYPRGYCHFPQYEEHYFKGLTAEKMGQTINKKGYPVYTWIKHFDRNEPLDCFDDLTEVLTEAGWRLFSDITAGDLLATVNLNSDTIEYQKPTALISRYHSGDMIQLKGYRMDILVTPNHRMVTYKKEKNGLKWNFNVEPKITLAKDLTIHHQIKCAANWHGKKELVKINTSYKKLQDNLIDADHIVDPVLFASFLGWYVSEGRRFKGRSKTQGNMRYRVEIAQTTPINVEKILFITNQLPWRFRYDKSSCKVVCTSKQLYDYLNVCGENTYSKKVPQWVKDGTPDIINSFLNAAINGDGWTQQQKGHHRIFRKYATVSKILADDIQELFLKIGKSSNITLIEPKPYEIRGRKGTNTVRQYHISELNKTKASLDTTKYGDRRYLGETIEYNGMVYCASVPNETLIVRRNGKAFIAGNCRVYARAAANVVGMDRWSDKTWDKLYYDTLDSINIIEQKPIAKSKPKKGGDFWRGR